jgi:hypothetical protein
MEIVRLDYIRNGEDDPAIKEYFVGPSFLDSMPSADELDLFRRILPGKEYLDVFNWWLGLVKDGRPPKKSDLLFREMARFADHLGLVICNPDGSTQIRVVGHGIEEIVGRRLRGMDMTEAAPFSNGMCKLSWQSQIVERRIRYYRRDLRHFGKQFRDVGIMELPVSDGDRGRAKYVLSYTRTPDER